MQHLFWYSLKSQLRRNSAVSCYLFLGVLICAYCISVMLGVANGEYQLALGNCQYATLTIEPGKLSQSQLLEFSEYCARLSKRGVKNLLYLSTMPENRILVGWEGLGGDNWFPITNGRFFTEAEQKAGSRVAFLSDALKIEMLEAEEISVGENAYRIIGTGWITTFNIERGTSSQAKSLMPPLETGQDPRIIILPFSCYCEGFSPEQILLHFQSATYEQLQEYAQQLQSDFPGTAVYLPNRNSEAVLQEAQLPRIILSLFLCLIAGVTVLQLMVEWIKGYRKELYVCHLCGLPKKTCALLVYGHWLVYLLTGAALAIGLHYLSFPLLAPLYADYPPLLPTMLCVLLVLYALSVACSIPATKGALDLQQKGE